MEVIYIANARIPTEKAHGIQIFKMCEAFTSAGANIRLIVPTRINKELADTSSFEFYNVQQNFNLKHLPVFDPVMLFKFPNGVYFKVQSFFFKRAIKKFLRQEKKDGQLLYTRDIELLSTLTKSSLPVMWEAHSIPSQIHKYVSVIKQCKKIIAISQGIKQALVDSGVSEGSIIIARDAVDISQFSNIKPDQELSKIFKIANKKIILYTGHLYSWKGVDTLIAAADLLPDDFQIVLVGGTTQDIQRVKEEVKDKKNITVYGSVRHDMIPQILQLADLVVIPNSAKQKISSHYTSPMKLFEYMASSKPIVASDLPSIREVISEQHAFFFKADDAESLAAAVLKAFSDYTVALQKAECAFNEVQQYTWQARAEKILTSALN